MNKTGKRMICMALNSIESNLAVFSSGLVDRCMMLLKTRQSTEYGHIYHFFHTKPFGFHSAQTKLPHRLQPEDS